LDRKLGGPQNQYGLDAEEKNAHHCPCRELNPGRLARSLNSRVTELSRLLYT
jgi:hypothetical protein